MILPGARGVLLLETATGASRYTGKLHPPLHRLKMACKKEKLEAGE